MPAPTLRKTTLALALAAILGTLGCSESADSLVASGEAALGKGDYRTAQIQLKSALQRDLNNVRARWLLGELNLATEDGAAAEKEIRRAGELGVGNDAVTPALAQALLLQAKVDAVLELAQPPDLSPRSRGEVMAAQGLALLVKGEKPRADELTKEALKLAPDAKLTSIARARFLIDANQLDEAEPLLTGLQQKHPDYGLAWSLMGEIQEVRGDLPKAEEAYTTAIAKRANDAADLLRRAFVRLRQQNLDSALADSTQLNKTLPNVQPAWYVTGMAHFQKKDFAKAQEALDHSYQLDNDHVPTLVLLGWSNANLGNLGQAGEQARHAVALAPRLVPARLLMATLYLRQQPPDGTRAEEMVRPVVDARPGDLTATSLLAGSLQAQGKRTEAAPLLEQIAAANPESLDVQTQVGLELLRAREPEKALEILGRAAARAPSAPRPTAALVTALLQQKKLDEALATAERFQEQNPKDAAALRLLAETQLGSGDQAKAVATYRKVLDMWPGDPPATVRLAEFLSRDNDLDGARNVLETALARHPDDAGLMAVLSQVAVKKGRADEAKALLRRAIEKDADHQLARLLLAGQLLAERDAKGALAVLPTEPDVKDARVLAARSQANLQLQDYARGRDDLERLAAGQPPSAALEFELANVHGALGEAERMHQHLDTAARLAPKDPAIGLAHARSLVVRGNLPAATAALAGLDVPRSDPALLDTQLLIAEKQGNRSEQLRLSRALFDANPSSSAALRLANALVAAGQPDEAERSLQAWLGHHPDDEVVSLGLSNLYGRSGRAEQAAALLRPLAARHPDNAQVLNNLAWYLQESSPVEALQIAEKVHGTAPGNPAILDTYAILLVRNGRADRALAAVDQAIQRSPELVQLRLLHVDLLDRTGKKVEAREELDALRAAGLPPQWEERAVELERRVKREP